MSEFAWIDMSEALAIHERLLERHGGPSGVRDEGLLASALARPLHHAAYADEADAVFLAALLATAIVRNHPFIDGNKRTGFVLGILFLELNGYAFRAAQDEASAAVLALAAGETDETAYATFLRGRSDPVAAARG